VFVGANTKGVGISLRGNWTDEDVFYLQDNWGSKSVTLISKHLDRPYDVVRRKAVELGLLNPTLHYDGITVRLLSMVIGISSSTLKNWITQFGFPAKQKVFAKKQRVYVVSIEEFWKWAENHKHLINFSRLEPLILGKEPEWVKEKRQIDVKKYRERKPWTDEDKSRLISMVHSFQYTYPEMAAILKHSESSIKRKLRDLNVKARPLGLDKTVKYTVEEIQTILSLLDKGYGFNAIADTLNEDKPRNAHKSASGIRGKLERMGFTFH
jgi:transposase-like protein